MKVDGTPRAALKTRIEKTNRVFQGGALGKCHLYSILVDLARAGMTHLISLLLIPAFFKKKDSLN
jgi:hypothetical protein